MKRSKQKPLYLAPAKPRNPLVAQALQRKAGAHGKPHKAERAQAKVRLRRGGEE